VIETNALREKVLDLAIRGKLVPQDPNDEPSSVLLERIRAEKQRMVKDGKIKAKDIKNDTIIFKGEDNLHYEKFADGSIKCIEDEIPFEVPEGWAWARMSSLTQDLPYGTSKKSSSRGEIAVLRMGNLQQGEIDYSDLVYSSDKEDIDKYLLTYGDLLFNRTNSSEWVGKTAIYRGEVSAIYAGYLIRIRSFLDAEYLNSVMNSKYAKEICLLVKTDAVNQSNINATKLGRFLIPVPPLSEQVRISNMVSEALYWNNFIEIKKLELEQYIQQIKSKILDLAIRGKLVPQNPNDEPASVLLERIRAEKEELIKQGKIKRDKKETIIFRGDDNSYYEKIGNDIICIDEELPFDIPHNWSWCRLGNIGDWAAGSTPSRSYPEYYNGTIPWLKTGDLNDGYITNIPESISEEALKNTSVRLNPSGSVLIAMYGATIGKLGILTFPATTNQACCACSPLDGINNHYLFYYLLSQKDNFVYRSVGGAQPNISKEKIVTTLMPVPPYEEQRQILDKIDIFFDLIRDIEKSLN
jgi:type I restriction enzyme S subunit